MLGLDLLPHPLLPVCTLPRIFPLCSTNFKKRKRRQGPETFLLRALLPLPTASQISCWQTTASDLCPTGKVFSRDRPSSVPLASLKGEGVVLRVEKEGGALGCELAPPSSGAPREGCEKAGETVASNAGCCLHIGWEPFLGETGSGSHEKHRHSAPRRTGPRQQPNLPRSCLTN